MMHSFHSYLYEGSYTLIVALHILYKVHTSVNISVILPASKGHIDVIILYTLLQFAAVLHCVCEIYPHRVMELWFFCF